MSEQQLRDQLARLSSELESAELTEEKRLRVHALMADINNRLGAEGESDTLRSQVEEAVSAFEVEHPRVAGVLQNIMVTLSSMGV